MARPLVEEDLLRLVDALAPGEWQSGEALALASGLTRAGLAKRVTHLRDWGLHIESKFGQGYRLARPLERLDADRIRAGVTQDLRIEVLPIADSTNRVLMDADPAADPQAVIAEYQSAGRGRRGRDWRSPFGAQPLSIDGLDLSAVAAPASCAVAGRGRDLRASAARCRCRRRAAQSGRMICWCSSASSAES
jgi:biotin operon repressor BirA-like protein